MIEENSSHVSNEQYDADHYFDLEPEKEVDSRYLGEATLEIAHV